MGDNSCEICHSVAKYKCSKCNKTHYCCKEHQIQDWPVHKGDCQPCKVIHNSAKGNILIATRVITTWSTIEKERPLIVLPYSGNDNRNGSMDEMCIGCFKVINPQVNKTCSKCGWPVCGPTCELVCTYMFLQIFFKIMSEECMYAFERIADFDFIWICCSFT